MRPRAVCSYKVCRDLSEHFSNVLTNTQVLYNCTQHSGQVFYFFYKIQLTINHWEVLHVLWAVIKHTPQPIRLHVICLLFYNHTYHNERKLKGATSACNCIVHKVFDWSLWYFPDTFSIPILLGVVWLSLLLSSQTLVWHWHCLELSKVFCCFCRLLLLASKMLLLIKSSTRTLSHPKLHMRLKSLQILLCYC
jgi:hypothetical protein